jgi:hypothetical protein
MRNQQSYKDCKHRDRVCVDRPFLAIFEPKIEARHGRPPSLAGRVNLNADKRILGHFPLF